MNTRELIYFITIADKGSLTQAAEALYVSQPTLTKYLQRLEERLGLKLFHRVQKTLVLTYAGKQYYAYAQNVLKLSKELQFQFDNITNANEGKIKIGLPPLLSSVILGKILPAYHKEFPFIEVEISENNSSNLEQMLKQGKIDIAFFMESNLNNGLSHTVLLEDYMNVIFPKEMPLKDSYSIEELTPYNIIIGYRYQKHAQYIYSLLEPHLRDYKIVEGNNSIAASILASNGYGVAFLSDTLLHFYTQLYQYNYSRLRASQSLYLCAFYRKDNPLPNYLTRLLEIAQITLPSAK